MADGYAEYGLWYGDVRLLVPSTDQVDYYWHLSGAASLAEAHPPRPTSSREFFQKAPFSTLNWPSPPPLGFNQLYWPSGATRWGSVWVLSVDKLFDRYDAPSQSPWAGRFSIRWYSPGLSGPLNTTDILAIPVRSKVFYMDGSRSSAPEALWATQLVDYRWWLQGAAWERSSASTIAEFIEEINTQLADNNYAIRVADIADSNPVDTNSLALDVREFSRQDLSIAEVIDAIGFACGRVANLTSYLDSNASRIEFFAPNGYPGGIQSGNNHLGSNGPEVRRKARVSIQYRWSTHWHRFNDGQEIIEVGAEDVPSAALIQSSAFWENGDATNNNRLQGYSRDWETLWHGPESGPDLAWPSLFPDGQDMSYMIPDTAYYDYGGNDCIVFTVRANESHIRLRPLPPGTYPSSLLIQHNVWDTWENLIVKTPSGGIPARTGTELTTASCDIYELDQNTMLISDTGDNVDVYSVGGAVPGNTYIVAVLMNDGTYAAVSGGSSGSLEILYVSPINAALMPGGAVDCNIMEYTGTEFQDSGAAPIEVRDSAKNNCVMAGEVVQAILSSVTGYYEVLGSSGLRRHVRADEALIPGQSSTLGPPPPTFVNEIQATMLDWTETYANRWRYADNGETSSFQVTVFDPALRSVVLPGEIVQVHYHQKQDRWMIEGGHGLLRRAQLYATDYLEVEAEGDFAIEDPNNAYTAGPGLQGYLVRGVNRSDRAVKKDSWTHILWTPSEGYTNEYGLRHGRWVMITDLAKTVDVKLLRASGGGELGQDHRYIILDPLSDRVLDDGNGNGVDPTSAPHKWRRMADVDYYAADWGLAWFDGRELNANSVPIGRYHLRWINEEPDTLSCTSTTEPPPPTEPPPVPPPVDPPPPVDRGPGYYCVQNSSGTGMICRYFSADPGYGVGAYGNYPTCLLNCDAQLP